MTLPSLRLPLDPPTLSPTLCCSCKSSWGKLVLLDRRYSKARSFNIEDRRLNGGMGGYCVLR